MQNCSSTPRDQVCVNTLSSVIWAKQFVDYLSKYRFDNPNKEVRPVRKEKSVSGLNKQIAMLIINTNTESAGTNLLILRS